MSLDENYLKKRSTDEVFFKYKDKYINLKPGGICKIHSFLPYEIDTVDWEYVKLRSSPLDVLARYMSSKKVTFPDNKIYIYYNDENIFDEQGCKISLEHFLYKLFWYCTPDLSALNSEEEIKFNKLTTSIVSIITGYLIGEQYYKDQITEENWLWDLFELEIMFWDNYKSDDYDFTFGETLYSLITDLEIINRTSDLEEHLTKKCTDNCNLLEYYLYLGLQNPKMLNEDLLEKLVSYTKDSGKILEAFFEKVKILNKIMSEFSS